MSTETLEGAGLLVSRRPLMQRLWRGGLQGSEFTWAVAFTVPYIALFVAFVAYPVAFGAWLGHEPSLYVELAEDPIFQRTIVNTILYVGIAPARTRRRTTCTSSAPSASPPMRRW